MEMVKSDHNVSKKLVRKLMVSSDKNGDNKIDADEFADMMLNRNYKDLFKKYTESYVDILVPKQKRRVTRTEVGLQVDGFATRKISLCPPPLCMTLISIFEITMFILNRSLRSEEKTTTTSNVNEFGPIDVLLVYDPQRRHQFWRFISYMLVHSGWRHLTTNLVVQIFLGIALEYRNRWWRVFTVYMAGILAGSLLTSVADPKVYLSGASGGVYAIVTAHVANMILNWKDLEYRKLQLFIITVILSADLACAFYNRYHMGEDSPVSYSAHFGGALAGLLVGIWILKNIKPTKQENRLWWTAFIIYLILMATAIMINIFWKDHYFATQY
ncbi:hypothetical protein ABEB36_006972 [Hypothenemus hampei]